MSTPKKSVRKIFIFVALVNPPALLAMESTSKIVFEERSRIEWCSQYLQETVADLERNLFNLQKLYKKIKNDLLKCCSIQKRITKVEQAKTVTHELQSTTAALHLKKKKVKRDILACRFRIAEKKNVPVTSPFLTEKRRLTRAYEHFDDLFEKFEKHFPLVAAEIPDACAGILLSYFANRTLKEVRPENNCSGLVAQNIWQAINKIFALGFKEVLEYEDYVVFYHKKEGRCRDVTVKNAPLLLQQAKNGDKKAEKDLEWLAGHYHIAFLLHKTDIFEVILTLTEALRTDKELRKLISCFKVKHKQNYCSLIPASDILAHKALPHLIVCPTQGKENAQKVLDMLAKLFKNDIQTKGTGKNPPFYEKINTLMAICQGDTTQKSKIAEIPALKKSHGPLFEKNMVYYSPNVTGTDLGNEFYHLSKPEH